MSSRNDFLNTLSKKLSGLPDNCIQLVAIDGVDGIGKTTLADDLALLIERSDRPVIRASVDGFHNSREVRYRLGKNSPEGFFRESYNYDLLKNFILNPLSINGDRIYKSAAFDVETDAEVISPEEIAPYRAILIIDGIFLHRPELKSFWTYSVFLKAPFEVTIPRGAQRGTGSPDILAATNVRYIEGQRIYLRECQPHALANIVVDFSDFNNPAILNERITKTQLI